MWNLKGSSIFLPHANPESDKNYKKASSDYKFGQKAIFKVCLNLCTDLASFFLFIVQFHSSLELPDH